MPKKKARVDVELQYTEDLTEVVVSFLSVNNKPLSGQDLIDAFSEALLLKYDYYDLTSKEDIDA